MEFTKINKEAYKEEVLEPLLIEKAKVKKYIIIATVVFLVGVIAMVCSVVCQFEYDSTGYWASFIIALSAGSIGIFMFAIFIGGYWQLRKRVKSSLEQYNVSERVVINPDFTVDVYKNDMCKAHISEISNVRILHEVNTIMVAAKIQQLGINNSNSYFFSTYLENADKLISCLMINENITKCKGYHNNTLKSIFKMSKEKRNQLFIEELQQSEFLIPIKLIESNILPEFYIERDGVFIELLSNDGKVCVYTSADEYKNKTAQFDELYLISFKSLLKLIGKNDKKGIMKFSGFSLTINPDNERVVLHQEQIMKIVEMQEGR